MTQTRPRQSHFGGTPYIYGGNFDDFAWRGRYDDTAEAIADMARFHRFGGRPITPLLNHSTAERIAIQRSVDVSRHVASLKYDDQGRKVTA